MDAKRKKQLIVAGGVAASIAIVFLLMRRSIFPQPDSVELVSTPTYYDLGTPVIPGLYIPERKVTPVTIVQTKPAADDCGCDKCACNEYGEGPYNNMHELALAYVEKVNQDAKDYIGSINGTIRGLYSLAFNSPYPRAA